MNLALYYAPVACSMVPYINLVEAGAEFSVIPLNLAKGQQSEPEYLRLNPKHKVPVLVIDGEPLTENVAINLWIARQFPRAGLLPADPLQELRAIAMLTWCASGIHPALTLNFNPKRFCDAPGAEASTRHCAQRMLAENFAIADSMLAGREFFFDQFGAADTYFFWTFRRAHGLDQAHLDLTKFTHCQAHLARMQQRPSVQQLIAFEKQTLAAFAAAG